MSKFIVFEGIDRSGKTTQINRLYDVLKTTTDLKIFKTREPWNVEVRSQFKSEPLPPEQQLDLILRDREQHCKLIRTMLSESDVVLCDRFVPSTIAYQGYGQGLDFYRLKMLNDAVTQGLTPDMVLVFDCSVKTAIKRGQEKPLDAMERDIYFLERVRWGYLEIADNFSYPVVNANQSEDKVLSDILNLILPSLKS